MRQTAFLSVLLGLCLAPPAAAQSARSLEGGLLTAFENEAIFQFGFRITAARVGVPGLDFSIATFPEALVSGFILLTPDLSITYPVPVGERVWLTPRVGFSAFVGFGLDDGGGAGGLPGYHAGIGVLGQTNEKTGLRLDLTHRRLLDGGNQSESMLVVSFGFAWFF